MSNIMDETIAADARVVWLERVLQSREWETIAADRAADRAVRAVRVKLSVVTAARASRAADRVRVARSAQQAAKVQLREAAKQAAREKRVARFRTVSALGVVESVARSRGVGGVT